MELRTLDHGRGSNLAARSLWEAAWAEVLDAADLSGIAIKARLCVAVPKVRFDVFVSLFLPLQALNISGMLAKDVKRRSAWCRTHGWWHDVSACEPDDVAPSDDLLRYMFQVGNDRLQDGEVHLFGHFVVFRASRDLDLDAARHAEASGGSRRVTRLVRVE